MTKLKAQRLDAIVKVIQNYGIEYEGVILMSLFECASELNNTWQAYLFVNREKVKVAQTFGKTIIGQQRFSVSSYQYNKFLPAIRHGVKNTDIELVNPGSYKTEYLIYGKIR